MRVDKFLKVSRLVKRRPLAKELADKGRVQVNGKVVKSSFELKIGDELEINLGTRVLKARVRDLRETTKKAEASELYDLL